MGDRKPQAHTTSAPPTEFFDRLYYDTCVFTPAALHHLIEDVGAGQVLRGTDHPFDLAEKHPLGFLDSAGLSEVDARASTGGTAARLLGLT